MNLKQNLWLTATSLFMLFQTLSVTAQPCVDGFSGEYPCENVDQLSFLSNQIFNAENANDIWGWTSPYTGREYAVVGFDNKTAFVDITSPAYPLYLGYLPTASSPSLWRDVKIVGDYCYIVSEADDHGMQTFDLRRIENLQEPETPFVFDDDGYYDSFGNAHNVVVDTANQYVYAVGTSTFAGGLHIIDVSDPTNMTYAGSNSLGGYVHDAQVMTYTGPDADYSGKEICIGFNADYLAIYDVTDKSDIEIISVTDYDNVGYVHQGWLTDDQRYLLSNDETDELDYGFTTRRIVWDLEDLDDPQVIEYIDYGNTSIDHNLYIHKDIVYESNYTSGLILLDNLEIGQGILEPFGYFDVVPQTDNAIFIGTWSNYPYFESGVVPTTNMYGGLHILEPKFFELSSKELLVCNEDDISMDIMVNKRIFGTVSYEVEMEEVPGLIAELGATETDGAPNTNIVQWYGLAGLAPGYYPGEVIVNYDLGEVRLPFVLIKEGDDPLIGPTLNIPQNEALVPNQLVSFEYTDPLPGYGIFQVAVDANFNEIVYEEERFSNETSFSAYMPYDLTTYFWRIVKPTACGDDIVTASSQFTIDIAAGLADSFDSKIKERNVFPNPATNKLFIEGVAELQGDLGVYDVAGRQVAVWTNAQYTSNEGMDLRALIPGFYVVKDANSNTAFKFVKQ